MRRPALARSPLLRATLLASLTLLALVKIWTYSDLTRLPYDLYNDFTPDWVSAKEWLDGGDPYAPLQPLYSEHLPPEALRFQQFGQGQRNAHPPSLILMVAPFASADVRDAHRVWLFIGAVAILAGLFLLLRELGARRGTAIVLSVAGLALPVVAYELRWAQTNGMSMLGIVLAWIAFRRRREGLGGAALGILTALRLFPLLLVVPLLVRRRWKAVRWFAGVASAVAAIGVVALGPGAAWTFVRTSSENFEYWSPSPLGISLVSAPVRWLRSDLWTAETAAVPAILSVIGFALLLLCVAGMAATRARTTSAAILGAIPWMILAAPIAWPHYLVMMLPAGIAAISGIWTGGWRWKAPLAAALAAVALAPNVVVATGRYFDPAGSFAGQMANSAALTAALLVFALAGLGRRDRVEPLGPEATG